MLANAVQLMQNYHRTIKGVITVVDTFAVTWEANRYYVENRTVRPTSANNFFYLAKSEGYSGATEPIWPTTLGGTVVDNEVTWEAISDADSKGWPVTALNPASFPLVMTAEGGSSTWYHEAGDAIQERTFDVHLFLHPQEAAYYPIARNDALIFAHRFGLAYTDQDKKVLSQGLNTVIIQNFTDSSSVRDSGLSLLEYSGEDSYGITFNVGLRIRDAR